MKPSRCTSSPPANPARAPLSVKASRRWRWMLTRSRGRPADRPARRAASCPAGSSGRRTRSPSPRAARSSPGAARGLRDQRDGLGAGTDPLPVPEDVVRDREHRERRDPCGETGEAHDRDTDEKREHPAHVAAAIASEAALPTWRPGGSRDNSGLNVVGFTSSGNVVIPAANAPTATKLMWPNEITPEFPMKA